MVVSKVYIEQGPKPKVVKVYGLLSAPAATIADVVGLEAFLNNIYNKTEVDDLLDDKSSLSAAYNHFANSISIGKLLNFSDNIFFQYFENKLEIYWNCLKIDIGGGYHQIQQIAFGSSAYMTFGLSFGIETFGIYISSNATNNAGSFPNYRKLFEVGSTSGAIIQRNSVIINSGGQASDAGNLILLDASNQAVEYKFGYQGNDFDGSTIEIQCIDSAYPVTISNYDPDTNMLLPTIRLRNDLGIPVSSFNMLQGDTVRLFFYGTNIRQLS